MPRVLIREVTVQWEGTPLTVSRQGIETPECRTCGGAIAIHQPDEGAPEHLLGTCGGCGAWSLIEVTRDGAEAYLFDLPCVALIRKEVAVMRKQGARAKRKNAAVDGSEDATAG